MIVSHPALAHEGLIIPVLHIHVQFRYTPHQFIRLGLRNRKTTTTKSIKHV